MTIDLSIVITGRHDNYGGDFNERLFRSLRFNHEQLTERGVQYEVVLAEWNPVSGRPYLADLLPAGVPEIEPSRLVRYVVDPRYHAACTQNPQLQYLEYPAKNVGVRRARGRFVLVTNTDVLFSRLVVDALAGGLRPGIVYRAPRIDIALGADQTRLTWAALDDPANHARRPTLRPPLYGGGAGDFLLLDRESWHRLRGFNEVFRAARLGVDHNFLVKAFGSSYEIADIGGPVYHVNHLGSYQISKKLFRETKAESLWGKRRWHSRAVVYDNPDGWGLGDAPEKELAGGVKMLTFDWDAVPRLIDLQRIVLPLRRAGTPSTEVEEPAEI